MSREGTNLRLAALALALLATSTAWAQSAENGLKLGDGRLHPYFDFETDYNSGAGFFDNATGTPTLSPEIIFHFRPGLRLELPESWINLNVSGDVDWVQFSGFLTPTSTGASHLEASANVDADLFKSGPVEFDVGDTFTRLDQTQNAAIGVGVITLSNTAYASLPIHPGGGALEVTPRGAVILNDYTPLSGVAAPGCAVNDPTCQPGLVSELNTVDLQAGLDARWKFLPKTALVVETRYDAQSYQDDPTNAAELLHADLGLVGLITSKIAITAKAGWAQDFVGGQKTVIGHAEVNYLISDTSNLKLGFIRDILPVPAYGTYIDDRPYAEVRFFLGGRLTLHAYGAFDYLNFGGATGRNDDLVTLDVGPQYQFFRWLIGSAGYTLTYRASDVEQSESVNYTVQVGYVRLTFTY
jgi:hypothetical protein